MSGWGAATLGCRVTNYAFPRAVLAADYALNGRNAEALAACSSLRDSALKRELQDVLRKTKQMANQIKEPADVWELDWELEHYLTERQFPDVRGFLDLVRHLLCFPEDVLKFPLQ